MIRILKDFYLKQQFSPSLLGVFVNPFYFARLGLYRHIKNMSKYLNGDLLDVGCGTKPYRHLFDVNSYVGLDIDSERTRELSVADFYYDGNKFPFQDDSFDSVVCNQVLEHVFNPDVFLSEIARVLKPGGKILLSIPFVWDEHEQPFDFARYSSFGLKYLLERHGLMVVLHEKTSADVSVIFQLMNTYFFKVAHNKPRYILYPVIVIVCSFFNMLGVILSNFLPSNDDLYLDNIVLAEKKNELL